ncbi:hypothetical protein F444_15612 [Phytophthora nicotianae P1976]|uniref:Uncharacterized protein n=1 Tax=Phytophthora nicotianae P1976 TaxID=1317066 RepID=A0A080ZLA8_PHYNI|nr:hypothetical protein F444_15612 [Phytophthora nicotianae P1976]
MTVIDQVTSDTVNDDTIDESSATTDSVVTATDSASNVTDCTTTATNQLYYPISGEYYTGRDITLDSKLVTTVEVWQVAYLNYRRDGPMRVESYKKLYMRSWEPRAKLMENGFEGEMDLVDSWKASEVPLFETFWREDDVGMGLIGADEDGLCVFNALRRASELAGRPDIVTQQDIDQFVDDELILYGRDLRQGARWKVVLRFLGRLRDAAVLTVQGTKHLIYDLKEGKPISSAKRWINFYAFFRPFKVFK